MEKINVRKGSMPSAQLTKAEFARRMRSHFYDPVFDNTEAAIQAIIDKAWFVYDDYHKSPRTHPAGEGFHDPSYQLSDEWRAAHKAVQAAEAQQKDASSRPRILLINGSSRSEHSCPGEMSKTFRMTEIAKSVFARAPEIVVDFLDLSLLTSQYGRVIYPCKACVSTAMPLCHWPCSCYPNHAIGQVNDWMNEIYPMWAAAHGVMIISPVHWYQAPSVLKLMIDRLVCADGGNPDPTTTHGKHADEAKQLELEGWDYPRHLAGRVFSVVVHGDAAGVENLRRMLSDWLTDIGLIPAGKRSQLDRYIGYYRPYATSHDDFDADRDFQAEVEIAAESLVEAVKLLRAGKLPQPGAGLHDPRPK
ncbi:MAG TPA: flavodoxin family protein [Xanthobacteraceae bacterium]|nr:flavodoxin family protein [Xanthobacteraceae bacterium]